MKTSYYSKYKGENAVSIAGKAPDWFKGRQYKKLAPKFWFFQKYKTDNDEIAYTENFKKEVLDKLDVQTVFNELGEDAVLLCWEKSGKFCHRHLVSKWFKEKLNKDVTELE